MYDRDGVFLLVKTNGSKLWRFRYFMGGKEQLMAFGEYPDATCPLHAISVATLIRNSHPGSIQWLNGELSLKRNRTMSNSG